MSAQASGWVWSHSPLKGAALLCHAAIADSVNDQNHNEFWMSVVNLAHKARVERMTASRAVAAMVELGLLVLLEDRPGGSTRYRFVMNEGVSREDSGVDKGCVERTQGVSPQNAGGESRGLTNPREPKRTTSAYPQAERTYPSSPRRADEKVEPTASGLAQLANIKDSIRPPRESEETG